MVNKFSKICVLGLGYIGLPTAALLTKNGFKVQGVDLNINLLQNIKDGKIHIKEPELDKLVLRAIKTGMLNLTSKPEISDVYIICVPTPFSENLKEKVPNIGYVLNALKSIIPLLKKHDLVIIESTLPVGSSHDLEKKINKNDIYFAYCPERVLPGNIVSELINNDRVVGGINDISSKKIAEFYRLFVKGEVFETDAATAEMCKLTENSYRDLNIAFANEISMICESENINPFKLINLANKHPRVNILDPGIGVGGHCIAVDPWFIIAKHPKISPLIKTSREANIKKTKYIISKIKNYIRNYERKNSKKPIIACLGLSYKPDTDDLRESPAIEIVNSLRSKNSVVVLEPNIDTHNSFKLVDQKFVFEKSDIIIILVKHKEFHEKEFITKLKYNSVLDFCGILK